jgi:molybdopterin-guanine dinucleotide biosynthesis protein A
MKMDKAVLIIIAGGKSSRMKRDKALLPFGGYNSLAEYQYRKFKPFFSKVYLSAKDNKFDFPAVLIKDVYSDSSPLVALVSIFETLTEIDEVSVLSVDSPSITVEVFQTLKKEAETESSVIVANSKNGVEPLCAIYRRTMLPNAKKMLSENRHRLQTLLESVVTQKVFFKDEELFINMNYPDDYERENIFSSNI